jgi:Tol biopolymer transport system component
MWSTRWLRPRIPDRPRRRCRPRAEQLEDRWLPSTLQPISLPPANQPPSDTAAGQSYLPAVSADGRYVAFESNALNLVPGQTGGPGANVFLLDRTTGTVALVSHLAGAPTTASTPLDSHEVEPLISSDGRYVAYTARDNRIVGQPGDTQGTVVVYDRTTGQNTLVSHTNASPPAPATTCDLEGMSADGRYIVFRSIANNVVPGEVGNSLFHFYLYDQATRTTFLIDHAVGKGNVAANNQVDAQLGNVSVADDGTVVYASDASDLVSPATSNGGNVYLYSPATQTNQLISTVAKPATADAGGALDPVISGDGTTVAYASAAANVVPGQVSHLTENVFLYNRSTETTRLVSGAGGSATVGGNADSGRSPYNLALSHDGRFLAFVSLATNLVPGQGGVFGNVFLYDAQVGSLALLTGVNGSPQVGAGGEAGLQTVGTLNTGRIDPISRSERRHILSISGDGGEVAFVSQAGNLLPGQTGLSGIDNVFRYSRATGKVTLVSGSATATGDAQSGSPVLSADGSTVAFHTLANDLGGGIFDGNGVADVFTAATASPGVALVSRAAFQQNMPGNSYAFSSSADGRYTVFTSTATNLVPNQVTVNANQNVFLFDQQTGIVTLVNHVAGLPNTTGDGGVDAGAFGQQSPGARPLPDQQPVISADGSTIAFYSTDDNLVPGQGTSVPPHNVYLYDVQTGQVRPVNIPGNPHIGSAHRPNGYAVHPALSADGRYLAIIAGTGTLVFGPGQDANGPLVLYDSQLGTLTSIVRADSSGNGPASDPVISDNGRYVAYLDQGPVYVYDRQSATSTLVSHDVGSLTTPANAASTAAVISPDGSAIAFVSAATDLVAGKVTGTFTNVYLYKNDGSGAIRLLTDPGGPVAVGGNGNSDSPAIDEHGDYVAFRSDASDLVPNQSGATGNIFEFSTQTGAAVLVSHQAGSATAGAGGSSQPVIDDDGHLVSYTSTTGALIPGQTGMAGVKNVFVWLRQTDANILVSGQGGSPTATGNRDSDSPVLSRTRFPSFSSVATNLSAGLTGSSVAFINTLVEVSLSPDTVVAGTPGSVVGSLTVTSLLGGQYLPPVYSLPGAEASNALFGLSGAALLAFLPPSASGTYTIRLHVDVGIGDDPILLQVFATPGTGGGGADPLLAELVSVRVGKHKKARLMVEVFDLVTRAEVEALVSPFQAPAYRAITLTPLGDGLYRLSARKGKHTVSILLAF